MSALPFLTLPLAALDFSQIPEFLHVLIRGFFAVVVAVVAYFVLGPVVRLLYRLAFQRPMSNTLATWAQVAGAVLVGLLVYWFLPLGGGAGGGWFGGGGLASGDGKDSKDHKDPRRDEGEPAVKENWHKKMSREDVLEIEMVANDWYEQDGRYYLIRKPDTPRSFATAEDYRKQLSTLKEVERYLTENAKRIQAVDILIYRNSPEREHPSVRALMNLAEKHQMRTFRPPEYQDQRKTLK